MAEPIVRGTTHKSEIQCRETITRANKISAANSAPRLQFCAFAFLIHLVAGGAALTGAVADLYRTFGQHSYEHQIHYLHSSFHRNSSHPIGVAGTGEAEQHTSR
jgi:hypothetical protein